MANPRALDKRRKSVRNIRKITRTMELIATARYKQAMDRAAAATAYTDRITQIVKDLTASSLDFTHPLLEEHDSKENATLLVLTSNRGLCGGYNGGLCRATFPHVVDLKKEYGKLSLEIAGKKGIGLFRSQRKLEADETFTHFEDKPRYDEVEVIANRYLTQYVAGKLDRLDVSYTKFVSSSKQVPVIETLLPLGSLEGAGEEEASAESMYEFFPSAQSILEEVVPTSFKVKLFKCFLDAAVSEQIARMVAMKSATENASDLIKQLSREYNRARQGRITNEIMEIIGGVEALNN
ncbi:ATP synthase F1 subunit gamma [Blastopirellula sp. J2-11]|uniref:ATP synthase F1 subunit gamma n=1 Tax=Blastopirellula sp. J2-11 TaxID=2943192 RepID=UPI0021C80999|nr:ATP synthase F1 subunit gamma [Blastopirellula sp. J2-11]UUO08141.1 ATP synthase F1 subunit gamma [Blastopirellula sp. J2-11]